MFAKVPEARPIRFSEEFLHELSKFQKRETTSPEAIRFSEKVTGQINTALNQVSGLFNGNDFLERNLLQATTHLVSTFGEVPLPPALVLKLKLIDKMLKSDELPEKIMLLHKNQAEAQEFANAINDHNQHELVKSAFIRSLVYSEIKEIFLSIYQEVSGKEQKNGFVSLEDLASTLMLAYQTEAPLKSAVYFTCNAIYKLCNFITQLKKDDRDLIGRIRQNNEFLGTAGLEQRMLREFEEFAKAEFDAQF